VWHGCGQSSHAAARHVPAAPNRVEAMQTLTRFSNSYLRCRARLGVSFGVKKIGLLGLLPFEIGDGNQSVQVAAPWIIVKNTLKLVFDKE
jgi:hypothetical protein